MATSHRYGGASSNSGRSVVRSSASIRSTGCADARERSRETILQRTVRLAQRGALAPAVEFLIPMPGEPFPGPPLGLRVDEAASGACTTNSGLRLSGTGE